LCAQADNATDTTKSNGRTGDIRMIRLTAR
jgi:hypothetical protein